MGDYCILIHPPHKWLPNSRPHSLPPPLKASLSITMNLRILMIGFSTQPSKKIWTSIHPPKNAIAETQTTTTLKLLNSPPSATNPNTRRVLLHLSMGHRSPNLPNEKYHYFEIPTFISWSLSFCYHITLDRTHTQHGELACGWRDSWFMLVHLGVGIHIFLSKAQSHIFHLLSPSFINDAIMISQFDGSINR